MPIRVRRDPRAYLLTAMAVALLVLVPLVFAFITLSKRLYLPDPAAGSLILWALIGVVGIGLFVALVVVIGRATQRSDADRDARRREAGGPN
jgi:Co/Zn/Cd efflux system component